MKILQYNIDKERGWKMCSGCNKQKELSCFYLENAENNKQRYVTFCYECKYRGKKSQNFLQKKYITKDDQIYKHCSKCNIYKLLDEFHNNKNKYKKVSKYNKAIYCKICANIWYKERYQRQREQRIEKQREYNKTKQCKTNRQNRWRNNPEVRERAYQWYRNRKKNNPGFKLACNLRSRIWDALNGKCKSAKTMELLGCTIDEFVKYIESKWEKDMSWQNYGNKENQWSIDHIKPCAMFDFTNEEEQKQCFHYSNMQPMWSKENYLKNSFYNGIKQEYRT